MAGRPLAWCLQEGPRFVQRLVAPGDVGDGHGATIDRLKWVCEGISREHFLKPDIFYGVGNNGSTCPLQPIE